MKKQRQYGKKRYEGLNKTKRLVHLVNSCPDYNQMLSSRKKIEEFNDVLDKIEKLAGDKIPHQDLKFRQSRLDHVYEALKHHGAIIIERDLSRGFDERIRLDGSGLLKLIKLAANEL